MTAPLTDLQAATQAEAVALAGELARIGVRLTQALERHVLAAEKVQALAAEEDAYSQILPPVDFPGIAAAFNRMARSIRMTLALQARLARPDAWGERACTGPRAPMPQRDSTPRDPDIESSENLWDPSEASFLPPVGGCPAAGRTGGKPTACSQPAPNAAVPHQVAGATTLPQAGGKRSTHDGAPLPRATSPPGG
jgi:hypothetical protein